MRLKLVIYFMVKFFVLISTPETELQHDISKVNDLCMKWGLVTNVDKSKAVIFSKNGRVSKDRLMFSRMDQYKYLGVMWLQMLQFW